MGDIIMLPIIIKKISYEKNISISQFSDGDHHLYNWGAQGTVR